MPYQQQVLGTVISSVMNFDQLCTSMGENPAIDLRKSTFVPCDGRSIAGSDLHKKTNIAVAPDLRGKFVRGLNVFYNPGEPDWDSHATGDPEGAHRNVSSYQPDAFANHAHAWNSGQGFNALEKELDHDDGELTATQKVRRGLINQKFARELEQIYGAVG